MATYLKTAAEIGDKVHALMVEYNLPPEAAVKLGHIVNLSVRACPRAVQHTVRKNIVEGAVGRYCRIKMIEEQGDFGAYHKIEINLK